MNDEIKRLRTILSGLDPIADSETYDRIVHKIRELESSKIRINPNTVLTVAVSVLELLMVMNYEQSRVFAGKAFSLVMKPKG